MDPALLRQRKEFIARALAQPTVEKRKYPTEKPATASNDASANLKKKPKRLNRPTNSYSNNSKASTGASTGSKFGYLAQIVNFMKSRHQEDDQFPLTIDEILDECKLDEVISAGQKSWLVEEALPNNPKLQVVDSPMEERKYAFKPKYQIRDRKSLYKLLDRNEQRGLGGIMVEDVEESLPNAKKSIRTLLNNNKIVAITRPDKKEVLFYNDRSCEFTVDEEFQKLWRSVNIESMDETKIEEYLNSQGISSVQGSSHATKPIKPRKRPKRARKFKAHNDHLSGVLEDYSENGAK